jgi:hypothetical protein
MIPALALLILGYDLAYYALNVLVWAHLRKTELTPVPLRHCFGIPFDGAAGPTGEPFMPPFQFGVTGATEITGRMLLGGEPFPVGQASIFDQNTGPGPGLVTPDQLPDGRSQLDPDQSGVIPLLPGEGIYGGIPGFPGLSQGIPNGVL